jgi:hypothetical protein
MKCADYIGAMVIHSSHSCRSNGPAYRRINGGRGRRSSLGQSYLRASSWLAQNGTLDTSIQVILKSLAQLKFGPKPTKRNLTVRMTAMLESVMNKQAAPQLIPQF